MRSARLQQGLVMEQYKLEGAQDTPVSSVKVTSEAKQVQTLESKIVTLENYLHDQATEIAKLRRDIGRMRADIDQLTNVLRRG